MAAILSLRNFLAATKQLSLWMIFMSFCPSVRPSVKPLWLCSHHRIIMKLSGVITRDQGKVHAKGQGQRSKGKITEVTTQLNRFRTVTPVWIHIWWWNNAYSLIMLRKGALLYSRSCVKFQGHASIFTQIRRFRTVTPVWIHQWLRNTTRTWSSIEEVPYCFSRSYVNFQGHTAKKIVDCDPNKAFPDCNSSLNSKMVTKCRTKLEVA